MPLSRPLAICTTTRLEDSYPAGSSVSWPDLVALLSEHDRREGKDGPLWSGATFDGNKTLENVRSLDLLILDFDKVSPDRGAELIADLLGQTLAVAHSSHSHRDDAPKFRVALPLSRSVTPAEYDRLWCLFFGAFPDLDHKCRDASHLYFCPSCPPDAASEPWAISSEDLRPDEAADAPSRTPLDVDSALGLVAGTLPDRAAPTSAALPGAAVSPQSVLVSDLVSVGSPVASGSFTAWCRKMGRSDSAVAAACEALARGLPYAREGERDETIFKLAGAIARKWPDGDPASIAEHFRSACSLTGGPTVQDVRYKIARAQRQLKEEHASEPDFSRDQNGKPTSGPKNMRLGAEALLRDRGRYDSFASREQLLTPEGWREIADEDFVTLAVEAESKWGLVAPPTAWPQYVAAVVRQTTVHPVREWLETLQWDGVARLDTWLLDLGAEPEACTEEVSRWFVMQAVARALTDAPVKGDYALVLEGATGIRKSTLLRELFGGPTGSWFSDDLAGIGTKDAAERIQGKWLVELAELASVRKSDQETLKGFLTRLEERYRPSYGLRARDFRRSCVFAGTTNDYSYVTDSTGARRFWPVRMTRQIDVERVREIREQLFAEAVARVKAGERYWPDAEEERQLASVVEKRRIRDSWEDALLEWLGRSWQGKPVSGRYLLRTVLEVERPTRGDDLRLATTCQRCGMARGVDGWSCDRPAARALRVVSSQ